MASVSTEIMGNWVTIKQIHYSIRLKFKGQDNHVIYMAIYELEGLWMVLVNDKVSQYATLH